MNVTSNESRSRFSRRQMLRTGGLIALGLTFLDWMSVSDVVESAVMDASYAERETVHIRPADTRKAHAPYPPSTLVEGITFSDRIIDGVTSGDQWAMTWADDGHLYSAWGDGTGFGYRGVWNDRWTTYLGVPRVVGNPPDHKGYNIWGGYQPESDEDGFDPCRYLAEYLDHVDDLVGELDEVWY